MTQGWEYAVVTEDSERDKIGVKYIGPENIAEEDAHKQSLDLMVGALGGKNWELVTVSASWWVDSHFVRQYFFKRPHDRHNQGADEIRELVRDATWSAAMSQRSAYSPAKTRS